MIGRDGRASGDMLSQAVSATLVAHGYTPVHLGVAATPTVGVEVRRQAAVAGVQISASHNPKEYNGLKLFGATGRVLPAVEGERVLEAYRNGAAAWVDVDRLGDTQQCADPHAAHGESVLATIDVDEVRRKRFRVLLDSNNGAGSLLGKRILDELHCESTVLGEDANGLFLHTPEPIAQNLSGVASSVSSGGFDVGFCQDPDADRLAIIDENGAYIGEELTLALCLKQALPKVSGTIVTNCATSSVSRDLANQHGCRFLQSAVGEANVCDLMLAEKAVFGGEGNGGPIDPQVGYVRDSFVGMARVLELLASTGKTISQLVAELPVFAMVKEKAEIASGQIPQLLDRLEQESSGATISRQDGLKLEWDDRWLLVRGSNTEPIVRFIAEARDSQQAAEMCSWGKSIVAKS